MTEKLSGKELELAKAFFDGNYGEIKQRIAAAASRSGRSADDITLLGATKTVPVELINYAASQGLTVVGENRVQELREKIDSLDPSLHKHFIGHLQTNKVKYVVGNVELIHSVDSVELANAIASQSKKKQTVSDILLEVNIGNEESKSGFSADSVLEAAERIAQIESIRLCGLMCIPPADCENSVLRGYFDKMFKLFIDIRSQKVDNGNVRFLSMGMSDDFETAIECGANIVRVGTALFGRRSKVN